MADKRAKRFYISHTQKSESQGRAAAVTIREGRPALTNGPTECSPKAAVSSEGFSKCSKGVVFSGCSLLQLAASGPVVSMPCSANPDLNQAPAHAHPQSTSQGGLTLSRDQNHAFDAAFLQGCSALSGGP